MEFVATVASFALKATVGRWGYSGKNDHPMYGDYEAQRHWMEVTINIPVGNWYRNTADNNLQYWGLDYPPLTAYISWGYGMLASNFYPDLVALHESKGHELSGGKLFMRSTVIFADILVLSPAIIYSSRYLHQYLSKNSMPKSPNQPSMIRHKFSSTLAFLLYLIGPTNVLIDHGHFQYNGVCIGLSLLGATSILNDMDVMGSLFFCLALNFKQMALYYAPVFFFVLLRKCADKSTGWLCLIHLAKVSFTVILSFVALWWPFCYYAAESETCVSSIGQVLSRQFPFSRGIFEDKVSNLWYAVSVMIDFRKYVSIPQMAQMSLCLTLLLISPVAVDLLRRKLSPKRMFLSLVNCSMAFFLASFQVHEKSLLLPLIPSLLLLTSQPLFSMWFQLLGAFTMFPMLVRDGLRVPYFAVCAVFCSIFLLYVEAKKNEDLIEKEVQPNLGKQRQTKGSFELIMAIKMSSESTLRLGTEIGCQVFIAASCLGMAVLHCLEASVPPPPRYPDLYPALFALFGAANLLVVYCAGVILQWFID